MYSSWRCHHQQCLVCAYLAKQLQKGIYSMQNTTGGMHDAQVHAVACRSTCSSVLWEIQTTFSISPSWLWLRQSKTLEDALLITKYDFWQDVSALCVIISWPTDDDAERRNVLPKIVFCDQQSILQCLTLSQLCVLPNHRLCCLEALLVGLKDELLGNGWSSVMGLDEDDKRQEHLCLRKKNVTACLRTASMMSKNGNFDLSGTLTAATPT